MLWVGDRLATEKTGILTVLHRSSFSRQQLQEVVMKLVESRSCAATVLKSGVYCILNTINGKRYVGQASDIIKRRCSHLSRLRSSKHHNAHLQSAFDKDGEGVFEFHVLERVPMDDLSIKEREWIFFYFANDPVFGYNMTTGGEINKRLSIEALRLHSEVRKGKRMHSNTRAALLKANKGRKVTKEARERMSEAQKGHACSDQTKEKLSESHKGRKHSTERRERMSRIHKEIWANSPERKASITRRMKGKQLPEQWRANVAAAQRRPEQRIVLSLAHKGKERSAEHCANISAAKKGKRPRMTDKRIAAYAARRGVAWSEERREKTAKRQKARLIAEKRAI